MKNYVKVELKYPKMKINTTHLLWVDIVRVVAMFGVVLLHVTAPLIYEYGKIPISYWWIANIYDSLARICVPLFFMISGYLLLGKEETLSIFLNKRVKKVVIPLVVWSIIYFFWNGYIIGNGDISFRHLLKITIYPVSIHLWFLYVITGIYLYVPILRIIVQNAKINYLYYFIALWLISVSFLPFIEKILNVDSYIDLLMISGYAGYFVLGYLLREFILSKRLLYFQIIVFFGLIGFTSVGTYYLSKGDGEFNDYFYKYLSLNIILLSASAFLVLKYLFNTLLLIKSKIILKSIRTLSSASLGIYLIHPILLYYLVKNNFGFSLNAHTGNPMYFIPITAIIAFSLSFIIIWVLRKVPMFRHFVP